MRLTTINPIPYVPKTDIEKDLCEKVYLAAGEPILHLWARSEYPFFDTNGQRVEIEADYEIHTGQIVNGLFVGGSIYLGFVRHNSVEIVWDGSWN